jgi:hypothetical protein
MRTSRFAAVLALALALAGCADFIQRNEPTSNRLTRYNYAFRKKHYYGETLFNAFDYGHATVYEAFVVGKSPEEIEGPLFDYIMAVNDAPPRLQPAEEALAPHFTRAYWRVQVVFEWSHGLHRSLNDILSDEGVQDKHAEIERVTDLYLRQPMALHWRWKRMDILMDGQPYSGEFKRRYPKWNGIIWGYHWFQNGVYEPLVRGRTPSERSVGVQAAAALFQCSRFEPPSRFPRHMPMSWEAAPTFAKEHPRAAAIFDNLHMLHDIVADVLVSEKVTDKRAELDRMVDILQDDHSFIDESGNRGMGPGGMGGMHEMQHGPASAAPSSTPHGGAHGEATGDAPRRLPAGPGATCGEGLIANPPAYLGEV